MERKAPHCKKCGGPTKGHVGRPGVANCTNALWDKEDNATAKEQKHAKQGTTREAIEAEEEE